MTPNIRKAWRITLVALLSLVVTACDPGADSIGEMTSELLDADVVSFSLSADRSNPAPLSGATVKGAIYVFHSPRNGAQLVRFFIDDPSKSRAPFSEERTAPFDLVSSSSTGPANAFDTARLTDGSHQLTVERTNRGTVRTWTISFNVAQPPVPLIEERFDVAATNFDTTGGTWQVVGGQYVLSNPAAAPIPTFGNSNHALHKTARTGDFTVQLDARTTDADDWADFAVIFSFRDANNYWYAAFARTDDGFTNGLFKVEAGAQTEVASFSSTVTSNTAYAVSIVQAAGTLTVRRNGAALATVTASPGDGRFGLASRDNAAVFDNLLAWGTALSTAPGDATAPSTPMGLTATAVSTSQINLAWAASTDNVAVTGYRVSRGGTSLGTTTSTQYSATGLTAATLYSFTVVALDAAGNVSTASAAASATTQPGSSVGFPDASNTGPSGTLTVTSGNLWINTPNAIIENRKHTGTLQIAATGVIIRNVHLIGNIVVEPGASVTILDTLVDNGTNFNSGGISGAANITVRRTEIIGGGHSFSCKSNCDIQDSYFHGQANPPSNLDVHGDGILFNEANNMIVKHNTLACDMPADGGGACSAALAMYGDWGPVQNVLVENNLFKASPAGYCMYGGEVPGKPYRAINVRVVDNQFEKGPSGKCAVYGPYAARATDAASSWIGNKYTDGTPLN